MSAYDPNKIKSIRALNDHIIVTDMNFDQKITHGGIIIPHSDKKLEGIHARWARVYAIGPTQSDVQVGQYVLVSHGRWTRGLDIDPVLAGTMRHLQVMKQVSGQRVLILEDDAQFVDNFNEKFEKVIQTLPEDWDIFYLGALLPKDVGLIRMVNRHWGLQVLTTGSQAYCVNPVRAF